MPGMDFLTNITFWTGLTAWFLAQFLKLIQYVRVHRRFDAAFLYRLGGMPSSHSALVSSVATSVGLRQGFGSPTFGLAMAFATIVMFDAQSVRRAAGQQARLLNQIVDELFKEHHLSQQKLVEFLGHTRIEVLVGLALGVVVALGMRWLF